MARTLNLGILAHVDAGKTSLTERLLHHAGVIDEVGSVDDGSTQTDSLALERQRGITIRSAVVSFAVGDLTVNLIDTPGHPDFIAEVERVLNVLDGVVLVVSAVEGVQPQTRVLMRALRRLRIPTLIFVNKIDRGGARDGSVLRELSEKLGLAAVPMGSVGGLGTRAARWAPYGASDAVFTDGLVDALTEHDDALLAAYVDDAGSVSYDRLRRALTAQVAQAGVHPVFFGSAATGAGVDALVTGIAELLPPAGGDPDGPLAATVFAIERSAGAKVAYVRVFSGTLRTRSVWRSGRAAEKVTAIDVLERGAVVRRASVAAGRIARVRGLAEVRIGDSVGRAGPGSRQFGPPTLETTVVPRSGSGKADLHRALTELAEQDPLIDLRRDDVRQEIAVSLYGEVQKEVLQARLADEYGIAVEFRGTTTVCIERLTGVGAAVERNGEDGNPFLATVGLRVEPAPPGAGVRFRLDVELGSMPFAFFRAVEDTVRGTLLQGLHGWEIGDCTVTMTHSGYSARQSHAHAVFDKSMSSTGRDFRHLTPLVLMAALREAGTQVCEPVHRFHLEAPVDTLDRVVPVLARLHAVMAAPLGRGAPGVLEGQIAAARVHELRRQLPSLTRGEGMLECTFDRYRPVRGPVPSRPRSDHDPLHREDYLLRVERRVLGARADRA